ncbi:LamG domain-containing protein [Cyclobacterium qasimii]|uniref:LamG-like jellyroll fold domain-containing protein n=1 Tax=Cyclobacterium qasimii M12-11B TaxID=641524 RepID=S7WMF1_9BACT|nr:LamG domain-containing protein [Cyclobacterium qasimii]EPR65383.1 hypothetical protein ADICYQ_5592 [Cyclobacterium qasimii M12-11B]
MKTDNNGPRSDAWGINLIDPEMVSHQGKTILIARGENVACNTLYFRVFDPKEAIDKLDYLAWNGWYKFNFDIGTTNQAVNVNFEDSKTPPQLRLAGMDLITVPYTVNSLSAADSPFRAYSDGKFICIFRQSEHGTLFMNRLMLAEFSIDVNGKSQARFALENAWEVRYKYSGYKDVPGSDVDNQSYKNPTGKPFIEPTWEFEKISGITDGLFCVLEIPTGAQDKKVIYVAVNTGSNIQLFKINKNSEGQIDYSDSGKTFNPIIPLLAKDSTPLLPISGLAPALAFYGEQEVTQTLNEEDAELQRLGRVVMCIPVTGAGLTQAMAIFDYSLDATGNISNIPVNKQTVPLVDGKLKNSIFQADTTSSTYPNSQNISETIMIVDNLVVNTMLLGQIEPNGTPNLYVGDDGLLHLYYGGPLPASPSGFWSSLDPNSPQAMVAQLDTRVNHMQILIPWVSTQLTEQASGNVTFNAALSGGVMIGATVVVTDTSYNASAPVDLCDIQVTYPAILNLPNETWVGVSRDVKVLAQILNGEATDDSADPNAKSGGRIYFDYSSLNSMVRIPLVGISSPLTTGPYTPNLNFVSSLEDIALKSLIVSGSGADLDFTFGFKISNVIISIKWQGVPAEIDTYSDVFSGVAGLNTYAYPSASTNTSLWALNTSALQIDAPLIFYPKSGTGDTQLSIEISQGNSLNQVNAKFKSSTGTVNVSNIPAEITKFIAALKADSQFQALNLGIANKGASGNVLITSSQVSAMGLADTTVLFDLLLPNFELADTTVAPQTYQAGKQKHYFSEPSKSSIVKLVGFYVSYDQPSGYIPGFIQNNNITITQANRTLNTETPELHSALWVRQKPQAACTFTPTENVIIPIEVNGVLLPESINLQPQNEWTMETWVKPSGSQQQQIVSFHNGMEPVNLGSPSLDYAVGMKGQKVFKFNNYNKNPSQLDSAYLQTGVSNIASFYQPNEFTWECWVQPEATPAPPIGSGTIPLGIIFQIGSNTTYPTFSIGLSADRHLYIRTLDNLNQSHDYSTTNVLPSVGLDGFPIWSHLAFVGTIEPSKKWTIEVILNGQLMQTFTDVNFATSGTPTLIIGGTSIGNTSMYGQLSQLRFWNFARTLSEIKRTWLTSLTGSEFGLLGLWNMDVLEEKSKANPNDNSKTQLFFNKAFITGHLWDAVLVPGSQTTKMIDDSFFLSIIATIGGLPPIEAPALAINGNWNHIALTFEAGGALDMNLGTGYNQGIYDWMQLESSESLSPNASFAVDAWVIVPASINLPGTIISKWAKDDKNEDSSFKLSVSANGSLVFDVVYISSNEGATSKLSFNSTKFNVADGKPHHIATVFVTTPMIPEKEGGTPKKEATCGIQLYVDGEIDANALTQVGDISNVMVNAIQDDILIGRGYLEPQGTQPSPDEDILFFKGTLGQLQFWNIAPSKEQLFPENYPRIPKLRATNGLVGQWNFREQEGFLAKDRIGGNDGTLSTSSMWRTLSSTSKFQVYSNGVAIGSSIPFTDPFSSGTTNQLCMGSSESAVVGLTGEIAQLSLYDSVRSMEEIQAQQFIPRSGSERGLIGCWNFSEGGKDITGGKNNASPEILSSLLISSDAPLSNEGPYVQNVYGGITTEYSESTPGKIAVGNYFDVSNAGTNSQNAVLKRQYILDPNFTSSRPIQIGELDLIFVGQVQTDPTLIGYIEGAPPVPSENLTRPYYLSPGGGPYMRYLDTSTVSLIQESSEEIGFSSTSNSATEVDVSGAFGIFGAKAKVGTSLGTGFSNFTNETVSFKTVGQLVGRLNTTIGTVKNESFSSNWGVKQTDTMGFSGGWENEPYLNPTVGRRFIPDNLGYAMVESLTGDLFSVVFKTTRASLGTIVIPNLDIPPDRNIMLFPMDNSYTKASTLDGKIGLMNDPDYLRADIERGSYFKPVEAYAVQNQIKNKQQKALAFAAQYDAINKGRTGNQNMDKVKQNLASTLEEDPSSNSMYKMIPAQGIVNKFVWTADGGIYSDQQNFGAKASKTYTGFRKIGGGGGISANGEFFANLGFAWSFDIMATHSVQIDVGKTEEVSQNVTLELKVEGEAFLQAWNPKSNNNEGAYSGQNAPGKVKAYRFSSFIYPQMIKTAPILIQL